jgi:hypothetical protein
MAKQMQASIEVQAPYAFLEKMSAFDPERTRGIALSRMK